MNHLVDRDNDDDDHERMEVNSPTIEELREKVIDFVSSANEEVLQDLIDKLKI